MAHTSIQIDLGNGHEYRVFIGRAILSDPAPWSELGDLNQVAVVTNATVASLYLSKVRDVLAVQPTVIQIGDGEKFKSLDTFGNVIDQLVEARHNRTTTIVALGGGVVGDLAGFVAATYQRGVRYVQVPTTLLAQVDAAVGGKTAINHSVGKNLVGAFYQPHLVIADIDTLFTLPEREYREGLAEVLKYGVIWDQDFFHWLVEHREGLLSRDVDSLLHAVERSVTIKAEVVSKDERERGLRAILNFGHTFGHAIEAIAGYGSFLHGEAVAIGMVQAAELSANLGLCERQTADSIQNAVRAFGLPVQTDGLDSGKLLEAMSMDKKVVDGRRRFILARDIGSVAIYDDVPEPEVLSVLNSLNRGNAVHG